jgi:hypothetical protein
MQPRPRADELLATVAEVLERDIVPALSGPAQHHARVAASLVGIVERELRLGQAAAERELEALHALLGDEAGSRLVPGRGRGRCWRSCCGGPAPKIPNGRAEVWPALMGVVSRRPRDRRSQADDVWGGE